ncbi:hypothetical protein ACWF94_25750 [Streptomyces sp. NPDC055078]
MTTRSAWHLPSGQTREDTRLAVSLGMAAAGPLTTRPGCAYGGLQLTGTAAASMQARLSPGRLWVAGTSAPAQGGYPVTVDADTLLTFTDGHATLPRIDALVVRVIDSDYDGSGRYEAVLDLIPGTPAAVPLPPGVPANAEPLYEIAVPAGASAARGITWANAITDRRRYTAALGGILPAGGGQGGGPLMVGQYRDLNGRLQRWNGTQWMPFIPDAILRHHTDGGHTTSAAYIEVLEGTTGPLVATFTAPPSGWVHISIGALASVDSTAVRHAFLSCTVRQGTAMVTNGGSRDTRSAQYGGTGRASVSTQFAQAVTPGLVHTATLTYRSQDAAATAHFDNRFVRVDPVA